MFQVRDIMLEQVSRVTPDCSVQNAVKTMLDNGVKTLMVASDCGRLVGTISDSELLPAIYDGQMRHDPVSLYLERDRVTVSPEMPVSEVVNQLVLHRVDLLPVVESGQLVGMVGRSEVMKAVFLPADETQIETHAEAGTLIG